MWFSTPWPTERPQGRAELALALVLALGLCTDSGANTPVATPQMANQASVEKERSGVVRPGTEAHPLLPGSQLQGEATLRYWGLRIYHARLWSRPDARTEPRATTRLEAPLVLELQYQRDLSGQAIAERSLQEMRRAPDFPETQAERWLLQLKRLLPDVRSGDRLTGHLQPGQGVQFWHNERLLGQVQDAEFARRFFGIWLSPYTSEPAMRLALLGLSPPEHR